MKEFKSKYGFLIMMIIILIIILVLWICGIIPKQIAKMSATNYLKKNFSQKQLEYVDIEWSSSFGGYLIKFKDKENEIHSFIMNNKYFPITIGQGLFEFEEECRLKEEMIDLSKLENYEKNFTSYEKAKELLNKLSNDYNKYLISSTETEDGKGLYLYFSNKADDLQNKETVEKIKAYINAREIENTGRFNIKIGINEENRQYVYILKQDFDADGNIVEVGENYIIVESENNNRYRVNANSENEFTNGRTGESIKISDIKVGDYYEIKSIIRNIQGEEWKKECLKNLANCYVNGSLWCNPEEITNVQNMGNYVIITLKMVDCATEYFKGKDNLDSFELKAIAYSNLNIPTTTGGVSVYNLKEETKGFIFWIGLDKNTIDNKYPVINNIEIYDK